MAARRVVVDGSNIATEGRTLPSLRQLNEAVLAFLNEYPDTEVTVVVDATFGHRIDPAEVPEFEEAEANNELVSPPAGAIGRGDAFLLRIAGKIGAMVLSNDSFQEFHGEHEWLFEDDRLIGGKPIAGIGWIFTPRTPVRGIKSRKAVKDAKHKGKGETTSGEALGPKPVPTKPPPKRKGKDEKNVAEAIAAATEESVSGGRKRRRKKRGARPAEPVNEALSFINFIAAHPLGSMVDGEVEVFTSHGAFVQAEDARCYVPISALGDPPPRAARDVLNKGETRRFVVQALDPQRRGIELALPEFAKVSGAPLPETIEAEITEATGPEDAAPAPARRSRKAVAAPAFAAGATAPPAPARKPGGRKAAAPAAAAAPAGTVTAAKKAAKRTAKAAPAPELPLEPMASAPPAPAKKAAAKKAGAKKAVAKKAVAKKVPADTAAKAAPEKAAVADTIEAADNAAAPEKAAEMAPAEKAPAKKAAKKAPAKAPAEKAPAKKAPAKKAAKKAPAKKAGAKKAAKAAPARLIDE